MQHKQKLLNRENNWNELKNYKPNDVVSDDGKLWQNVSGINTKPGSLSNNDWIVIDDSIDYAKIEFVNDEIDKIKDFATAGIVGSINPSTVTTDLIDGVYNTQIPGTYPNAGNIVVKEGYYTLLRKEGGVWKLESEVKMPTTTPTGIVYPENPNAVSGGEVYNSQKHINDSLFDIRISPNLFDKATMIKTGAYVLSAPIDAGLRLIANWDMVIIPISANTQYTISGWNSSRREIGFYSEIVNPNNIPSTGGYVTNLIKTGISSNIGYGTKDSGKLTFTSPSNAKCLLLTVKNATETTSVYSQLQVELGAVATDYQDYGTTEYQLKDGVLSGSYSIFEVNLSQTEESYILTQTLKGEKIKQIIKPFREIYYPFDVGNVLVNNNLVTEWTDETAPFRFDGTTLGGNHEANLHNKNRTFALFVDGEKITEFNEKYYPKQNFSVVESYDIEGVTTPGLVAKASLTYVFDKRGGCTIYTDVYAVQNMAFQDVMFVMANNLNGTLLNYIPKSKSFTYNSVVYDFTTKYSMDGFAPSARLDFIPARYESIPDRLIALNKRIGFAIGYLPLEDTAPSVRPTNSPRKALQIHNTTKKIYMSAIDNASKTNINTGEYFSTIAYKVFYSLDSNYTSNYVVETNDSYYLYLDFHTSGLKNIKIPNELSGLTTELIESKDAILVSKPKGDILVNVSSTYAYLVIRFKK